LSTGTERAEIENTISEISDRFSSGTAWHTAIKGQSWQPDTGAFSGQHGIVSAMPSELEAIEASAICACVIAVAGRAIGAATKPQMARMLSNRNMVSLMPTFLNYHIRWSGERKPSLLRSQTRETWEKAA
jgi:hypothetical protein